jgi:uncharacterized protein YyaL (SSP411 family)
MQTNNNPLYTNDLINETSPYLLQHAHNPVNWKAWSNEVLKFAAEQNKILLISIGYSACHWCHVMENESFTDLEVANLMNEHFICIKVDREERPDVDQLYMEAVQIIKGQGGWPLNCFALSDGSPFWGATYFPKENWLDVLNQIVYIKEKTPQKLKEQAEMIKKGIIGRQSFVNSNSAEKFKIDFDSVFETISYQLDNVFGGTINAPKFPMPVVYQYLLYYYGKTGNKELENHLILTLKSMAEGGIFDQLGGGFSRYATDNKWNIPHFEKMLYDNAQLISLYSNAYIRFKNPFYRIISEMIIDFVDKELKADNGLFYCALDADSENEEGKFYVWEKTEIENILKDDAALFCNYYNVTKSGNWESGKNILFLNQNSKLVFSNTEKSENIIKQKLEESRIKLLSIRNKRIKPQTDTKIILSWNALMIDSYINAYLAFDDEQYLLKAKYNLDLILETYFLNEKLLRLIDLSGTRVNAMLDDYAFLIQNLVSLYQHTANEEYIFKAKQLTDFCLAHFYDKDSALFYYTSDFEDTLVIRSKEIYDNVIPSSNAVIFRAMYYLSIILEDAEYKNICKREISAIKLLSENHPTSFAYWLKLMMEMELGITIVSFIGKGARILKKRLYSEGFQNVLILFSEIESNLPFFKGKFVESKTMISVCSESECYIFTEDMEEAIVFIKEKVSF